MYQTHDPGMFWATFGALWIFGCMAVLIIIWHFRSKQRIERLNLIHQERMKAMEKGIPLPEFPQLDEEARQFAMPSVKVNPKWPLGLGALCIMTGLGVTVAFLLSNDPELAKMWSLGFIGVFFGIGLAGYYVLTRTPRR